MKHIARLEFYPIADTLLLKIQNEPDPVERARLIKEFKKLYKGQMLNMEKSFKNLSQSRDGLEEAIDSNFKKLKTRKRQSNSAKNRYKNGVLLAREESYEG